MTESAVTVENLVVTVPGITGPVRMVDDISFEIAAGNVLGIVGESGSGKSLTALSLMRLHRSPVRIANGFIRVAGTDVRSLAERDLEAFRGNTIAMIYQNPMSALNPVLTIGNQLVEAIRIHNRLSRRVARNQATDLLAEVGIDRPAERLDSYPFELSGGMLQRVVIAMAMSCSPRVLIADEATTALDVTTQARVLDLLRRLIEQHEMAVLFITHDLAVASEFCDDIQVMYSGRIVERGTARQVFEDPRHPYTLGLLGSLCTLNMELDRPIPTMPRDIAELSRLEPEVDHAVLAEQELR